jgi:hypothetical protein
MHHHGCHLIRLDLNAFCPVADIMVLTEAAEQITGTHEQGSGPILTHQGIFFTKVGIVACNPGLSARAAKTDLTLEPVHLALPGAESAGFHCLKQLFKASPQLAFMVKLQIGRLGHP